MNKQAVLFGIGGLIIGVSLSALFFSSQSASQPEPSSQDMSTMDHGQRAMNDVSMDEMSGMLENKSGDEFDAAFIEMMIPHHEGAISMAHEAKKNAQHQEIKDMAEDIISSQQSEIDQMKQWQKEWGYAH